MPNEPKATLDFETRSGCSLKSHGTWRYSIHPTTEILCLVYRLPHWERGRTEVYHPAIPSLGLTERGADENLAELFEWIEEGKLVEAHNIWFEFCIWNNILVKRYGWPEVPIASWRCSAAKAATHSMHRDLDKAASALRLKHRKDKEGAKVMKKMTKPRKSRKAERKNAEITGIPLPKILYHESLEMLDALIAYCRQDVLTEEALSHALPDLNPQETLMFQMDLRMNSTGFQLDKEAVETALRLIHRESVILNHELSILTDRQIQQSSQRKRLVSWLTENGLPLPNTKKATLDALLNQEPEVDEDQQDSLVSDVEDEEEEPVVVLPHLDTLDPKVRRVLEIMRALGRSSTAKFLAMQNWVGKDWKIRGGLLYHGASTGRWSGKGVQPHNFPRGSKDSLGQDIDMETLWEVLKSQGRDIIADLYNSVMEALANALRGAIVPSRGHQLFVADYSSIEARVLLWVADDEDGMDVFRRGECIYCYMASDPALYNRPITKEDKDERALGKVAILGLGYQMGWKKFVGTAWDLGKVKIDDATSQKVVGAYRARFWRVKNLWYDQEAAAVQCVETGKDVRCGKVLWMVRGKFLYCQLPSGRRLAYPYPEVKVVMTSWGEPKPQLSFMGVHPKNHKWTRLTTYGGMIVENIVQAIARDIMAEAMLRAQGTIYEVLLSVHDELIAEAPLGQGSVEEFKALLTKVPTWAPGCPIGAEGWRGLRYRK